MNIASILTTLPKAVVVFVVLASLSIISALAGTLAWAVANNRNVEFGWPTRITTPDYTSEKKCRETRLVYEAEQREGTERIKIYQERIMKLDQQISIKEQQYVDARKYDEATNVSGRLQYYNTARKVQDQISTTIAERNATADVEYSVRKNLYQTKTDLNKTCNGN